MVITNDDSDLLCKIKIELIRSAIESFAIVFSRGIYPYSYVIGRSLSIQELVVKVNEVLSSTPSIGDITNCPKTGDWLIVTVTAFTDIIVV